MDVWQSAQLPGVVGPETVTFTAEPAYLASALKTSR